MDEKLTEKQITLIKDALAAGSKIEAIKIYRDATNNDLRDSKQFIDSLIVKLKESEPHKYSKLKAQGSGCATLFLLFITFVSCTSVYIYFI